MVKLINSAGDFIYLPIGTGYIKGVTLIAGAPDYVQLTVDDTPSTIDLIYEDLTAFEEAYINNKI
jgi:hypothetical protein